MKKKTKFYKFKQLNKGANLVTINEDTYLTSSSQVLQSHKHYFETPIKQNFNPQIQFGSFVTKTTISQLITNVLGLH